MTHPRITEAIKGRHQMLRKFVLFFLAMMAQAMAGGYEIAPGYFVDQNRLPLEKFKTAGEIKCINCPVVPLDHWHLLTKSRGGTVSLLKNLTEHECQFALARALGLPATPSEVEAELKRHPPGSTWTSIAGDIETAECFE